MTTLEQEPERPQSYLEGRLEEQSRTLQDLKAGQVELNRRIDTVQLELIRRMDAMHQELSHRMDTMYQELSHRMDTMHRELNQRMDTMYQELSHRMDAMHQELSRRIDTGLQGIRDEMAEGRAAQRQLMISLWVIGGGIIATLIGGLVTLALRGG